MLDEQAKTEINEKVVTLTAKAVTQMQAEQDRLGMKHDRPSLRNINARFQKKDGLVNRIQFRFKRSGVFVEKGAGRGHGGNNGSQWKNKEGQTIKTNPKSLGKMNTGKRRAKEWFNPVIQNYMEQLTQQVAQEFVNISFKKLRIK